MLISLKRRFVFIANLKTASTSIERVLARHAEVALVQSRFGKHMGLTSVLDRFGFLFAEEPFERFFSFAVMREPAERLLSLYRSHQHEQFNGRPSLSTKGMSFEAFLDDWLPANQAQAESQSSLLLDKRGRASLTRIIRFEDLDRAFPAVRRDIGLPWPIGTRLPRLNPSAAPSIGISDDARARIAALYPEDTALYAALDP
ncbi:sulfotransferase family 2 domain-containing protein [Parvularcula lutaonensis]|uniref:Sulfotransferase family 2 domain-containing protein n=1 Tax=Parvularcula lutaonensis TaxID=491923 RepID=A0ABV7MER7_9PROT|nr:sulfotransferase family 2 domain-containing protein [Parvularcula lutaonensis]GGY51213.1 hypothetical protein GCM10007148_20110 [Parvularcula lutaonensis]